MRDKLVEIVAVCRSNKRDFILGSLLIIVVLAARIVFADSEVPIGSIINFFMLLGILYKISEIVSYLKCLIPAIKHLDHTVNGK